MNDSALIKLTYLSRRTVTPDTRKDTELLVEQIIQSARELNRKLDVTGILLVGERCFAQILEGPASAVDEIFEQRVLPAKSHTDVLLLSRGPTPDRSFQDWNMALVHDQTGSLDRVVEHRAWEIKTSNLSSERPSLWPLDLLLDEVSRIVGQVASTSVKEMMTDCTATGSTPP